MTDVSPLSLSPPAPNTDEAIEFLKHMTSEGKLAHLFAISEGKPIEAISLGLHLESELRIWIDERQGKANQYFSVNELKAGVQNRKAQKLGRAASALSSRRR